MIATPLEHTRAARRDRRAVRAETISKLRSAGIPYRKVNVAGMLVINHRGAHVDVWPSTGMWRIRVVEVVPYTRARSNSIDELIELLKSETLPEWMTRVPKERACAGQ